MALPLLLPLLSLPLNDGGGLSSFDFRFSARRAFVGRKLSGGEADIVLLLLFVELLPEFDDEMVVVVLVVLVVPLVDVREARPFALAFRNLL